MKVDSMTSSCLFNHEISYDGVIVIVQSRREKLAK